VPKRCAIFSASFCEPVPEKILTEGFITKRVCREDIVTAQDFKVYASFQRKIILIYYITLNNLLMAGIKEWNKDERPREKMLQNGANTLSNAELLAILIQNGTKDKSALDLAKELLNSVNNNWIELSKLSIHDLLKLKIKGIGPAKAITISAALQIGTRREMSNVNYQTVKSSSDIALYLKAKFQYHQREVFTVVYLNAANRILHEEIISEGGITGTVADPRIILKKALQQNATAIILSHNHPSGNLKPSRADEMLTQKIKEAASLLDIKVIDHIITSQDGYFSFADEGMI